MFRPSIQKLYVIVLMAMFCVIMIIISLNSKFIDKKLYYSQKIKASEHMEYGLNLLKKASQRISKKDSFYQSVPYRSSQIIVVFSVDLVRIIL